jgi:hypothetical protein
MLDSQALRGWIPLAAMAILAAACRGPLDPFSCGSARATVTGLASSSAGIGLRGATIHIACAGGTGAVSVLTDSTGRYLANLTSGSDPFEGNSGKLRCQFTEPAAVPPPIHLDTVLGFVRGPVLPAKQFVDLREP